MNELNAQFRQVIDWLESRRRVLLISHQRPDGDALGCLAGMVGLLRQAGKDAAIALFESCPSRYEFLLRQVEPVMWPSVEGSLSSWQGLMILDTCAWNQMEPAAEALRQSPVEIAVLDHHVTTDPIGQVRVIDRTASSACLLVAELARQAGWMMNEWVATALFTGMATDTGWFRFSGVDSRTLETAGLLVAHGARPNELYETLFLNEPGARIRLLGELLSSLELYEEGRLAVVTLPRESFAKSGATQAMTEDLINEPQRIGSVAVAVLIAEHDDGIIRVSFRSKRGLNVAELARQYGGGGHERASGARIRGQLIEVKARVIQEVRRAMRTGDGLHAS
jgi:bifunctional oligoribonuclease and PAP phosphatase NrnA